MRSFRCVWMVLLLGWACSVFGQSTDGSNSAATAAQTANATVRLFAGSRSGTAFFVTRSESDGKDVLWMVTAAHVFEQTQAQSMTLVGRFRSEAGITRRESTLRIRRGDNTALWKRLADHDVAILRFTRPDNFDVEAFRWSQLADDVTRGTLGGDCVLACFPASIESSSLGFPVIRRPGIASFPVTKAQTTFLLDYQSFGGDSGGPVVVPSPGRPMVLGMVVAMQRQTDKAKMPYREIIEHTPMGLGVAIHGSFIRDLIKSAEKEARDER